MTDAPKNWRDMTPAEKGALLLAHHEGWVIEWDAMNLDGEWVGWSKCDNDCLWDGRFAYRAKPVPIKPREWWISNNDGFAHDSLEGVLRDPLTEKHGYVHVREVLE